MQVFRITKRKYSADLSGIGAAMNPGRWNKRGSPVIYTSETRELALLEILVNTPPMMVPDLDLLTIKIPGDSWTLVDAGDLPGNWQDYPAPSILAEIGERWIREGKTLALKVPSAIMPMSYNYILNCAHQKISKMRIIEHQRIRFDPRLTS
jgi:RES domain-containing protein